MAAAQNAGGKHFPSFSFVFFVFFLPFCVCVCVCVCVFVTGWGFGFVSSSPREKKCLASFYFSGNFQSGIPFWCARLTRPWSRDAAHLEFLPSFFLLLLFFLLRIRSEPLSEVFLFYYYYQETFFCSVLLGRIRSTFARRSVPEI